MTTQDKIDQLTAELKTLRQGLGKAEELLGEINAAEPDDPKEDLVQKVIEKLKTLPAAHLQSATDYIAYLAHRASKGLGPGGGDEQVPAGGG